MLLKIFLTLLCIWGGGGGGGLGEGIYPTLSDFFDNFFLTQARSLKFSDFKFLSFRHNVAKFH